MQVLNYMLGRFNQRDAMVNQTLTSKEIKNLFAIRAILKKHVSNTAPTIDALAQSARISPTKLKNNYKQFFGQPIYQYYLSNKMDEARRMLESGRYNITEVGSKLGYANLSHFAEAFKKQHHLKPSDVLAAIK